MSIKISYFNYLEKFGRTVSLNEFSKSDSSSQIIGLRHDIDHDLDLALEMSYWEREYGCRATYFLLPTASYWQDEKLLDKVLQIQDFGHEIGLHLNVLTEWLLGEDACPEAIFVKHLVRLRDAGVQLSGTSAHGDKLCYENNFLNYWLFNELCPVDPRQTESGRNAEGLKALPQERCVHYPASDALVRGDGASFPFWSVSMREHGILYDAVHLDCDGYFTDSGGAWSRSPDPLHVDLSCGRNQVLVHPEYWRGSQKIYFFLSTARSGSTWLSKVIDEATPLIGQHEFSLNHRYHENELVADHNTGLGFKDLVKDVDKAKRLLLDARAWIEDQAHDYAEANVYLERFLPLLKEVFPDALFVHLHRDPKDVARSLINRDWYDTPMDERHPAMEVEGWEQMTQFEKVCWYVRITNENLLGIKNQICLEQATASSENLEKILRKYLIPFYPRLAEDIFKEKVNSNRFNDFPSSSDWPDNIRQLFSEICDPLRNQIGYDERDAGCTLETSEMVKVKYNFDALLDRVRPEKPTLIGSIDFCEHTASESIGLVGFETKHIVDGLELLPKEGLHGYVALGGGQWGAASENSGWLVETACIYEGRVDYKLSGEGQARLFCLMYDQAGQLIQKKMLKHLTSDAMDIQFYFRVRANAYSFNLALHVHEDSLPESLVLRRFVLSRV